jgi:Family of unknown function (DUF6191)
VAVLFFMTIPGLAIGLLLLAAVDRLWTAASRRGGGRGGPPWRRDGRRPAPAPGFDELQAMFYASKRHAIEQRRHELVIADDQDSGAPPRVRVDLDTGQAIITPQRDPGVPRRDLGVQ